MDDLISRSAAIDALMEQPKLTRSVIRRVLMQVPTIDPESLRPKGMYTAHERGKLVEELRGLADMTPPICDRDRPETTSIFGSSVTVYCKPFEQFQDVLRRAAEALADDGVTVQTKEET